MGSSSPNRDETKKYVSCHHLFVNIYKNLHPTTTSRKKQYTPPKFNMEPENDGFQSRNLQTSRDFGLQVPAVKFQGCNKIHPKNRVAARLQTLLSV